MNLPADHLSRKSAFSRTNRPVSVLLFALVVTAGLTGCGHSPRSGKERGDVVLTVTYSGEPLTGAFVNLENLDTGEGGGGEVGPDGTVQIDGVVTGTYAVVVLPPQGNPVPDTQATGSLPDPSHFPQKFRTAATTPLEARIESGRQEFTFDLAEADSAAK